MCHVLIIEDEPLIAMVIQDLLEAGGATSFAFADSQDEAVSAAIARPPAFITSDVKLLKGTGPLAIVAIRILLGPVPVVFITGTPDECEPCDAACRIFRKPFDHEKVLRAFHEMALR